MVIAAQIAVAERVLAEAEAESESGNRRVAAAARKRTAKAEFRLVYLQTLHELSERAERVIWAAVWKTPQATQWERRGWFRDVAMYVRHQAKAEAGSLEDSREARAREDRLGLNDVAMLRLRWEIADAPAGAPSGSPVPMSKNNTKYGGLRIL